MTMPTEEQFEAHIANWLVDEAGYDAVKNDKQQVPQPDFDANHGLDTAELFTFLGATQIDPWNQLVKNYGGDPNVAQAKFADRLASELDSRGAVDVLRHGVVDRGVTIRLAYFRPARSWCSTTPTGSPSPASCVTSPGRRRRWTSRCSSTAARSPPLS